MNTKFVALLVGAAVLVLGAGVGLYWFMFNKTGDSWAEKAREAEAAGDWQSADTFWGNAVGHENTNLEWLRSWVNAMGHIVPPTETKYREEFAQLRSVKRQISVAARTDEEATEDYLRFCLESFSTLGGGRSSVDSFLNEAELMIAYYPEGGPLDEARNRLRRFKGIARSLIAGPGSTLTQEEIDAAKADLNAALAADPGDGESMRALLSLLKTEQSRAMNIGRRERVEEIGGVMREAVESVREADPENIWGRIAQLELEGDSLAGGSVEQLGERRPALISSLDGLFSFVGERAAELDLPMLERLHVLEAIIEPESRNARSLALYERVVEANPERTDLLLRLAALRNMAGDHEGAMAAAETAESQPWLPVSLEGYLRVYSQKQAPKMIAEFSIGQIEEGMSEERVEELLAQAREARERFAGVAGTDTPIIEMLDGKIEEARAEHLQNTGNQRGYEDALNRALAHYSTYNERTEYRNRDGLWREGLTAIRLNKTGLAQTRFETLLQLDPSNATVLLGLADVQRMLGTPAALEEALRYTERALELAPTNQMIRDRVEELRKVTYREQSDDPIEALVFESERLRQGVDSRSPDVLAAEELLRDGIGEHGQNPKLIQQLVRILMLSDRLDEAGVVAQRGLDANPESEMLQSLVRRLGADSLLDIILEGINDQQISELDKLLKKVEAARRYGEAERAQEFLRQAVQTAPDDPDVVEQQFLQELGARNLEEARRIADRAVSLNADRLDGITYQARLLAAQRRHGEAVELLREAVARRPNDAPLWRLLASEQAELGQISDALASFRKALGITINDETTIRGYVALLAATGQTQEALSEARRLREFGEYDPGFLELYLTLESSQGGEEGRRTAIQRRRQIVGERPFDVNNRLQLARLYTDDRQWEEAKTILDELKAEGKDSLARVSALAKWYADQGRVRVDGEYRDGIELARGAFIEYIVSGSGEDADTVDAYIEMARFMLGRGRDDVALRAVEEARADQDPERMRAEKLYGEIMMRRNMPRQAIDAFRGVVEAGADEPSDAYRKLLIEMLLRVNEYEAAGEQIAQLSEDEQSDLTVLMQRADIAMAGSDQEEALRLVDRAIELHPSRPLPYIKRAQFLMPNEALARDVKRNLEEALRLNPNDYQAHKLMATMHFREDNLNEAIASLRSSLRANPDQDSVLVSLLIELIDANRVGEAVDVANEVVEARPTDATLMLVAGRVFMRREQFGRAADFFAQAWELTRDSRVAMAYIDALLRSQPPGVNRATRVIQELEVLGVPVNDDPQLLGTRAAIEARGGKDARAASFLTRAFEQSLGNPSMVLQWYRNVRVAFDDDGQATSAYLDRMRGEMPSGTIQRDWLAYGAAMTRIQDEREIERAEQTLRDLQGEGHDDLIRRLAFRLMGSGRYGRDDFEGAAAVWREGIEAFPDDWEMHNNLAYCVGIELGNPSEAVPLARQAAQLAPSRADVFDTLGKLLLSTGQLDEAEDALLKAQERLRTERERVNVLLNLARLAIARGDINKANRFYTQADTAVYTLPELREIVADDLSDVKQEIDSAQGVD